MEESGFKQEDAFPAIAQMIRVESARKRDFVTHQEIVLALQQDPRGQQLIRDARRFNSQWSETESASNMVAWWSQKFTTGESEWAGQFSREKVDGSWAYKPTSD